MMALSLKFAGVLAFHLLSIACEVTAMNPCYFLDENIAPEFVPCSPNGDGDCCVNSDFARSGGFASVIQKDTIIVEPAQTVFGGILHVRDTAWQIQTVSKNLTLPEHLVLC
jgi:hypothetical protein